MVRNPRGTPGRRHVGVTLPRAVKRAAVEAADVLGWSVGAWVLAAAAEHGPRLRARERREVRRRTSVQDTAFTALYLTPDELEELDELAEACGFNRSALVTAVARLALGEELDTVRAAPGAAGAAEDHG